MTLEPPSSSEEVSSSLGAHTLGCTHTLTHFLTHTHYPPLLSRFVKEIAQNYEGVEVKYIGGHSPEIHFLDAQGGIVEVCCTKANSLSLQLHFSHSPTLQLSHPLTLPLSVVQTVNLQPLSTDECVKLLTDRGFKQKQVSVTCISPPIHISPCPQTHQ